MDQRKRDANDATEEQNQNGSNQLSLPDRTSRRGGEEETSGREENHNFDSSNKSEDDGTAVNTSAILTPQMIQDLRSKEMEREMREMARQQVLQRRQRQQQQRDATANKASPAESSPNDEGPAVNHNSERGNNGRVYPSQLDKYWDKQFGRNSAKNFQSSTTRNNNNNFASQSSGLASSLDIQPANSTPAASGTASKMKGQKDHNSSSVPAAPGAYAQEGPGGPNLNSALLDEENYSAPVETTTTASNSNNTLVEANKVDDAEAIVDATDVQQDNFKRRLIIGTVLVFALALAIGLALGLKGGDETPCDDFCCDQSDVPIGHLPLVSCRCFGKTKLIYDYMDDNHKHHGGVFSREYFDKTKIYFMEFLKSEEEAISGVMGNSSSSFNIRQAIGGVKRLKGNTCHPYDQLLLMFSNDVTFNAYMYEQRLAVRNSHLMLASLFIATNGTNWTNSEGWFDADSDDADEDEEFGLCDWFGLECLYANHVSSMNLQDNNLDGTLPSELFMFSRLQELDVSGNDQLTGTIPTMLGNLVELTSLSIGETAMNGTIPSELANIHQLHELTLSGYNCSGFHGEIPPSLFNNTFLRSVSIESNGMGTSLPSEVGLASNLQRLRLFKSSLKGQLPPNISNLSSLKVLDLSYNLLDSDATIPDKFASGLPKLEFMNLAYSGLDETIPESFCNNSNAGQLLVAISCKYPVCKCCRDVTDGTKKSTGEYMVDYTCVQKNDAWDSFLEDCKNYNLTD